METMAIEMSWFAILNDQDIVEEIMQMPSGVSGSAYIKISAEDRELIGKLYNRETEEFVDLPVFAYSTDEIRYKQENKGLSQKLDEIQYEIDLLKGSSGPGGSNNNGAESTDLDPIIKIN